MKKFKKSIEKLFLLCYIILVFGCRVIKMERQFVNRGVAQLVARVVWDHEVAGSIPVASTIKMSFLQAP